MEHPVRISVVIPARNGTWCLGTGLDALAAQRHLLHEVIVVDDCSTDGTAALAGERGATVVRMTEHRHANHCRNAGARMAGGDVVLFLDHDVVVRPDTIARIHEAFAAGDLDALVGVYSDTHRHPALASRFKNFWIRYSYLRCAGHIDWIFGAVSAIRRDVFHAAGGFDRLAMLTDGIDDLEFGKRITGRTEFRIALRPDVEVEHLKSFTLRTLLANDLDRARAFVRLAARLGQLAQSGSAGFANVSPAFLYATALSWPAAGCAALAVAGLLPAWAPLFPAAAMLALDAPFLHAFRKRYGWRDALGATAILTADHLASALGAALGVLSVLRQRVFSPKAWMEARARHHDGLTADTPPD